ncbi:MATE family efflux transporter [Pikeienuella sp. HZG-20]|uniref:MATE family efflux transporter n=1 Tax=Paludibacillus litoralis TaxID=3133267 RepID=UPI0030EB532C
MAAEAGAGALTHRRVLRIAAPIVIANATVPLLGVVDTGVVGQLGLAAPIGAVGLGAIVISFVYWAFGFLRMGTAGLTAQALGAGDDREAVALLIRGLLIAAAAGAVIILLRAPLFALALQFAPASPDVETLTRDYLAIRAFGAPAAIAAYAVTGWLIAAERTRAVLFLQLWINGLNIALDLWFVLGLGWGVEGVAVATIIAEWSGAALGLWICRKAFHGAAWRTPALILQADRLRRMALVNGDIMIRSILLEIGMAVFVFRSAALGDVGLAANQVLLQFVMIASYVLDGFAFAAEALVGRAMGARAPAALRRAAILSSQWAGTLVLVVAVIFIVFGPSIIALMTTAPEIRAAAEALLPWLIAAPLIGMPAFMLDGIFIGATRTRDMRNAMAVSLALYLVLIFTLAPLFGAPGLWAAFLFFFAARGVTLGLRYPALEASARG